MKPTAKILATSPVSDALEGTATERMPKNTVPAKANPAKIRR